MRVDGDTGVPLPIAQRTLLFFTITYFLETAIASEVFMV